jgi:hypothetical protein
MCFGWQPLRSFPRHNFTYRQSSLYEGSHCETSLHTNFRNEAHTSGFSLVTRKRTCSSEIPSEQKREQTNAASPNLFALQLCSGVYLAQDVDIVFGKVTPNCNTESHYEISLYELSPGRKLIRESSDGV